jgi:hypothetical protein
MATGATTNYFLPYPLSTDPVRVAGDIEQLATKLDNDLQEIIEDKSSLMWTGGTFSNGISTPTYNDTTGKMSMSLAQDIRTTATPTFTGVNLVGGDLYLGTSRSIIFEGSGDDANETTFVVTNPTEDRTITFQNGNGTIPFASDVHFIGTTSVALNRASAAQSLTGITSIDGSAATLTNGRTIAMTGDVTWTSDSFNGSANVTGTSTISNGAVTYAKMQNVSAQYRILGRISSSAGAVEELTPDHVISSINQGTTGISVNRISGTLPVANGGTGTNSTATAGSIVYGNGTSFAFTSAGSAGQVLTSNGTDVPTWSTLPGSSTITISGDATGSGTNSITLTLANSGVTAATYGSSASIPVIQVDAKGRITSASETTINIPSDPMPQILMMAGM